VVYRILVERNRALIVDVDDFGCILHHIL
jgi:hypothetical protein